ncbi:MAG: hypothetical protein R3C17_02815 [Planctomycetaceae bacterium]
MTQNTLRDRGQSGTVELTNCPNIQPFCDGQLGDQTFTFSSLEMLGLSGSANWIKSLADLGCCPNLERLDLSSREETLSLVGLKSMPKLSILTINRITTIESFDEILEVSNLEIVNCNRTSFPNVVWPEIKGWGKPDDPEAIQGEYRRILQEVPINRARE